MADKKVLGWGKCAVGSYSDIVEGSCQLSVDEGQETEALIEGGEAEGRKKASDKYTLTFNRRIGDPSEVEVGYTEEAGEDVVVTPENVGAVGCTLKGCSRHIAVKFDSTDGLVAVYTYKTKGKRGADGKLADIAFQKKTAGS